MTAGPDYRFGCAAFSPDGRHVLVGGPGGFLRLWSLVKSSSVMKQSLMRLRSDPQLRSPVTQAGHRSLFFQGVSSCVDGIRSGGDPLALPLAAAFGPMLWSDDKAPKTPHSRRRAPKIAKSKIDRVTVYPNSALVTREVEVPDGEGLIELTVTPMPDRIVPSTMYSEAGDGLRVLTTRFTTRQVLEDTSEERRKLEAEMEKFQVSATKIESDIVSLQKNMDLLTSWRAVTQNKEAHRRRGHRHDQVRHGAAHRKGQGDRGRAGAEAAQRASSSISSSERWASSAAARGKMERDAIVVVDREAGKGGKIRLNYLVSSVTWRPEYKVRAGKVSEDVQVDYLANLKQHSGEDWNQVKMTLSTAQPMLNASPPELCMLQPILVTRGSPGGPPMPGGGGFASPFANTYAYADRGESDGPAGQVADLGQAASAGGSLKAKGRRCHFGRQQKEAESCSTKPPPSSRISN